jgi:hypothetical protein
MAVRSRFSTRTVVDSKYLVPWLAADGPLAYCPTDPPTKDYFFQYTWILPEIFDQNVNLREHRYFGSPFKDDAGFLFDFWTKVRSDDGAALPRYCEFGLLSPTEIRTPLAAYRYVRKPSDLFDSRCRRRCGRARVERDPAPVAEFSGPCRRCHQSTGS